MRTRSCWLDSSQRSGRYRSASAPKTDLLRRTPQVHVAILVPPGIKRLSMVSPLWGWGKGGAGISMNVRSVVFKICGARAKGGGTYLGGTIFWRRAKEGGQMRKDSRMHASRYGSSWHSRSVAMGCVSRPAAAASWSSWRSLE